MACDKFKIYIPLSTKIRLLQDAELFDFAKNNGEVNLNAFLRTLVLNYLQAYSEQSSALQTRVCRILIERTGMAPLSAERLAIDLLSMNDAGQERSAEKSTPITLTVSNEAHETMCFITESLLMGRSLSQYMKDMFFSYLSLPRSRREKIVFKPTFETVARAIKEKRQLSITSKTAQRVATRVMPYSISSSKEEQFNYLLCYDIEAMKVRSYRMSRLGRVFIQSETYPLDESVQKKLLLAKQHAPQFSFQEVERSCVRLTTEGFRKFKLMHTNRPSIIERKGDLLYFEWPINQLIEYFKRFGKDAVVLEPDAARIEIKQFFQEGVEAYREEN